MREGGLSLQREPTFKVDLHSPSTDGKAARSFYHNSRDALFSSCFPCFQECHNYDRHVGMGEVSCFYHYCQRCRNKRLGVFCFFFLSLKIYLNKCLTKRYNHLISYGGKCDHWALYLSLTIHDIEYVSIKGILFCMKRK